MEEKLTILDFIKCFLFVTFFSGIESVIDNVFRAIGL